MTNMKEIRDSIRVTRINDTDNERVTFRAEFLVTTEDYYSPHEMNPDIEPKCIERVKDRVIDHLYADQRRAMAEALRSLRLVDHADLFAMNRAMEAVMQAARFQNPLMQTEFSVGDRVRATEKIERVDKRYAMYPGEVARITEVSAVGDTQIVNVILPDGHQMVSIVCYVNKPFIKA